MNKLRNRQKIQKILSIILLIVLINGGFFSNPQTAEAATFTFTQTDWSGETSASTIVHSTNQSGWTR